MQSAAPYIAGKVAVASSLSRRRGMGRGRFLSITTVSRAIAILGMVASVIFLSIVSRAHADQRFWCLDDASSGYIMDSGRQVGADKSKPQAFMRNHTAVRFSEQKAYLNFQGLGEKEFQCIVVHDDVIQCVGLLKLFVFDKKLNRFALAQLDGYVADSPASLVLSFGVCRPSP
jgi:hypothetical protein